MDTNGDNAVSFEEFTEWISKSKELDMERFVRTRELEKGGALITPLWLKGTGKYGENKPVKIVVLGDRSILSHEKGSNKTNFIRCFIERKWFIFLFYFQFYFYFSKNI